MITTINEFRKQNQTSSINEELWNTIKKIKNVKGFEFSVGDDTDYGTIDSFEEKDGVIYANTTTVHRAASGMEATSRNKHNIDDLRPFGNHEPEVKVEVKELTEDLMREILGKVSKGTLVGIDNFSVIKSESRRMCCHFTAEMKGVWMKGEDIMAIKGALMGGLPKWYKIEVKRENGAYDITIMQAGDDGTF